MEKGPHTASPSGGSSRMGALLLALLAESLRGGEVLATLETLKHLHRPDGLVEEATCLGQGVEAGREAHHPVLSGLAAVLLDFQVEQLLRPALQVEVESPRYARIETAQRVRPLAFRVVPCEVYCFPASSFVGIMSAKYLARTSSSASAASGGRAR